MLHIVIDARRIRDFGIGTYIRSLIHALGQVDRRNRYTIVTSPADVRTIAGLQPEQHVHLMLEVLLDLIAATNATNGVPLFSVAAFTASYNAKLSAYASLMVRQDRRMVYGEG